MIADKQLVVGGLMTHYVESGAGDASVLLLHGWGDDCRTFAGLQRDLSKQYMVIALDLPGFGGTDAPETSWGLNDYASFVRAFLDKLQQKPQVIIGHSNGGAIALRGLAERSFTADKLILLASAGIRDTYNGRKKALRFAAKTARLLTAPLPKNVQAKIKKKAYQKIGSDLFVAEHLQETFKKVVTDDVQVDAENVRIPTLLIYGTNDTATPPLYGEMFAKRLSDSQLKIIEGAGHFIHHDAADTVCDLVRKFIS